MATAARTKPEGKVQPASTLAVRQKLDLLHQRTNVSGGDFQVGMESYTCTYCAKVFSDLRVLKSHLGMHTGERPFPCSHCLRCFKNKYQLRDHLRVHTGEKPFRCPNCPKAFAQKNQLNLHLPTHNSERPFVCGLCGKSFKIATTLQTHLKFHSDERPYACPICHFAFHLPSLLRSHMRTHTGERPYPCKFCGKRFKTASTRKVHERSHEPEPAFKCPDCERCFTYASNLAMHRRTHRDKEQCACPRCSRLLANAEELKSHLADEHGNRSYACGVCKETFAQHHLLEDHLQVHQAEAVAFTCYHCHKTFKTETEYRTHVTTLPCVKLYGCGKCEQRFETISQLNGHMWSHKPPRSNRRGRPPKRYVAVAVGNAGTASSAIGVDGPEAEKKKDNGSPIDSVLSRSGLLESLQLAVTYKPRLFCGICFSEYVTDEELKNHMDKVHGEDGSAENVQTEEEEPVAKQQEESASVVIKPEDEEEEDENEEDEEEEVSTPAIDLRSSVTHRRFVHTVSSANHHLLQKCITVSVSDDDVSDEQDMRFLRELHVASVNETSRRTKRLKQGWPSYFA